MTDFSNENDRLKVLVESYMLKGLQDSDKNAGKLFEAMRYSLEAPGKRIRPVLLLLCCKAVFGDENEALPYACAIEFIHNYSLIHDDLPSMDDDDLRRGRPTNHKVFGEALAILAGDGLLSEAFESIHRDYLSFAGDPEALLKRVRAGALIAGACGCRGMVAGQVADILNVYNKGLSFAGTLDFIHENKTAALIRASAEAGAILGGAGEDVVAAFSEYGRNLGLAFQIADDILDIDTEEKSMTYPLLYGPEKSRERLAALSEEAVRAVRGAEGTDASYVEILVQMAKALEMRTV